MLVIGLVDVPWWFFVLAFIAAYLAYSMRNFRYFKKQGIPGPRPLPILGTTHLLFFGKPPPVYERDIIKKYGTYLIGCPDMGWTSRQADWQMREFLAGIPSLNVYDEDILSDIMVKEFHSFQNRLSFKSNSPVNDSMLVNLKDAHWKHVRNEMTPTFTTGKLKKMNSEISRCASTLANSLAEQAKTSQVVEMKEYTGGYTMDVISSTAFGIRVDSQKDRNNAFVEHARRAFTFTATNPVLILVLFFPEIVNLFIILGFKITFFAKDILEFFANVTKQTMDLRKSESDKQAASRSDFLQLMIKAQRGENIHDDDDDEKPKKEKSTGTGITTDEILANAMLFFVAGYDTTSTSLSFFMYNMACNPEIQDKLLAEINSVLGEKDSVDPALISEMHYLDQCINENLRIHPPALRVNRVAKKDITIRGVFIRKGTIINIPIYGIHMDPLKWPEPDKFDPERFSAENKMKRNQYHFIPFGNGPRNCIGMRLALQELKVAVVNVLRKVKLSTCEKTQIPVKYAQNGGLMRAESLYLKVEPRT